MLKALVFVILISMIYWLSICFILPAADYNAFKMWTAIILITALCWMNIYFIRYIWWLLDYWFLPYDKFKYGKQKIF